jgi:hypothetical protein
MGRFDEYTVTLSGKTYTNTNQAEIVSQAKYKQPMGNSKAYWKTKKNKNLIKNEGLSYLDEDGNPIKEEVLKILSNKKALY